MHIRYTGGYLRSISLAVAGQWMVFFEAFSSKNIKKYSSNGVGDDAAHVCQTLVKFVIAFAA